MAAFAAREMFDRCVPAGIGRLVRGTRVLGTRVRGTRVLGTRVRGTRVLGTLCGMVFGTSDTKQGIAELIRYLRNNRTIF